jgi:hypothetical protein
MNAALPLPPTLGELRDELVRFYTYDMLQPARFAQLLFQFEAAVREEVYAEVMRLTGRKA